MLSKIVFKTTKTWVAILRMFSVFDIWKHRLLLFFGHFSCTRVGDNYCACVLWWYSFNWWAMLRCYLCIYISVWITVLYCCWCWQCALGVFVPSAIDFIH